MTMLDKPQKLPLREAAWYRKGRGTDVLCGLCPHECHLKDGEVGRCLVRENRKGTLYTRNYGQIALKAFPVNRPQYPLTLAGFGGAVWITAHQVGCPMRCSFCAAGELVQPDPAHIDIGWMTPEETVAVALSVDALALTFTANEPTTTFEFLLDTAKLARAANVGVLVSTSGFVNAGPLEELAPWIDGITVGIKAFNEEAYRKYTTGDLASALRSAKVLHDLNVPLEIHYLLIPTVSDSDQQILELSRWIRDELGPETPLAFMRFVPRFKLKNLPPTPLSTVERAMQLARGEGLLGPYAFLDSLEQVVGHSALLREVRCPYCGKVVASTELVDGVPRRTHHLDGGRCTLCGRTLPGLAAALDRVYRARNP
jgi:pyruvate formate lyase activating enzyme